MVLSCKLLAETLEMRCKSQRAETIRHKQLAKSQQVGVFFRFHFGSALPFGSCIYFD